VGAWFTDIFAYFTGRLFGKHKLIPDVSPKKTVEGSIGGMIFCSLAFVGYAAIYNLWLMPESGDTISYVLMALVGLVASVVSQVGDLSMSVLKRHYGIKDFGWIFPGHGGILDRFDSVLAVSILLAAAFSVLPV
jgi:phosphatidate cytidylyltransferase